MAEILTFPTTATTDADHAVAPSNSQTRGFKGAKYNAKLNTTEIAALIRADLKAMVEAGKLPRGKYSVRTKYYSGGSNISVSVSGLPFVVLNRARVSYDVQHPNVHTGHQTLPHHTIWAQTLLKEVEAVVESYNRDNSDPQTDYFDVKFYSHINFDWQWEGAQRKAMEAQERANPTWAFTIKHHQLSSWGRVGQQVEA